jgi:hypothetical protein
MFITSMGTFGFLAKAHNDQNLVSGDVLSKIAVYDEKIRFEQENVESARKALKQLDESVDQVMSRSTDEKGADKAVSLRRSQSKERSRLIAEITTAQQHIQQLNEGRAPIAAEVRKVEAEVGPIKYIAAFVYGATDTTILEKAVTWVIITLIIVFDPLAVVLLLSSQYSFQRFREIDLVKEEKIEEPKVEELRPEPVIEEKIIVNPPTKKSRKKSVKKVKKIKTPIIETVPIIKSNSIVGDPITEDEYFKKLKSTKK